MKKIYFIIPIIIVILLTIALYIYVRNSEYSKKIDNTTVHKNVNEETEIQKITKKRIAKKKEMHEEHERQLQLIKPERYAWDSSNIFYWTCVMGTRTNGWQYEDATNVILRYALENNVSVISNVEDFVYMLYYMRSLHLEKQRARAVVSTLVEETKNIALTNVFIDIYTNEYNNRYIRKDSNDKYTIYHAALEVLVNYGTPEVIDTVNKIYIDFIEQGVERNYTNYISGSPRWTISPDKYPEEAKEWLLHYPIPSVRNGMANRWYKSSRPEAAELMFAYIDQLEDISWKDPLWGNSNPYRSKNRRIEILKDWAHEYERMYKRYIEDKKRMPLHYGVYSDDSWEEYKNLSEKERKRKYGKKYGTNIYLKTSLR